MKAILDCIAILRPTWAILSPTSIKRRGGEERVERKRRKKSKSGSRDNTKTFSTKYFFKRISQ